MDAMRAPLSGTQRKDGRWQITVTLTRGDGAKIRKTIYAPTQREVIDKAHGLLYGTKRVAVQRHKIRDAWELWEREGWPRYSAGTKRQHTWAKPRIIAEFGDEDCREITAGKLLRWLRKLVDDPKLSGNSPKHLKSSFSAFYAWLLEIGWADMNPAREVTMPRGSRKNPQRPMLTAENYRRILQAEPDPVLRDLWETLGETALRPSEALQLTSDDLPYSLDMWWAKVRKSKTEAGTNREVPLPDSLAHRLKEREGPLFPGWNAGTHVKYRHLLHKWNEALDRAEVPRTNLYQLRKMAISRWIASGMPDDVVKELAGHSTIRLTKDVYNRLGKDRLMTLFSGSPSVGSLSK